MKLKKTFRTIFNFAINTIVAVLIIGGVTVLIGYLMDYRAFIVLSGSMEPEIGVGSLVIVDKKITLSEVQVGDIITFNYNDVAVTHRANEITSEGIITKGDNNETADGIVVTEADYIGKNLLAFPGVGHLVVFFQSTIGMITCASFIALLFVLNILLGDDNQKAKKKTRCEKARQDESAEKEIRAETTKKIGVKKVKNSESETESE